ncbi:Polypeptide N-acetylgalactosaminyltransferase 1 [Amphibalanus amphitrite]|uniref:Polypeptide N-acetylgalactosaminyltransferase 1 n=1 Tax=Amphibalanus amphitrite TaxID=1232801 RepID=A0A6A4UYB8_AMPAM|nr:Polypeptide N-acetylgalactosaminyltransferase 1 [Amphibalanus amphitrite]
MDRPLESEFESIQGSAFYSCDPPWLGHRSGITFRVDLPVATRRSDPPAVHREAALRAIAELPHPDVTIWSDGSARGGRNRAAQALIQFHHLNREETVRAPAGAVCSSLRAELTAMREAFAAVAGLEDGELASTKSPVMSGGLYAISREYFWHLGGYDTGMDVYGGENLELSFRTWQCGGVVETLPCSRVGHIFRDFHPYSFPFSGNPLAANMARIAAVWMDEYSRYFYLHYRHTEMPEAGDVTARRELREQLQCHSFRWYLDNVYPNKMRLDEDVLASGQVRSALRPDLCIDTLVIDRQIFLGLNSCTQPVVSGQYLTLSKRGELRREDNCAYAGGAGPHAGTVMAPMAPCTIKGSEQQQWIYDGQ